MRHFLIAVVIGVLTIGISIFVLSDRDNSYEADAEVDKNIVMDMTYGGENYDLVPRGFECREFEALDLSDSRYGCVLSVEITNTSIFDQVLILDEDVAAGSDGTEYPSSQDYSTQYVADNGLVSEIGVDETAVGGIFFDVPEDVEITELRITEVLGADPIIVSL